MEAIGLNGCLEGGGGSTKNCPLKESVLDRSTCGLKVDVLGQKACVDLITVHHT